MSGLAGVVGGALFEARRAARGWRWRTLLVATPIAAWWFSRGTGFGEGASVHFPGGPAGTGAFPIIAALAAVVLAVDSISCWERGRSRVLLDQSTRAPLLWLGSLAAAIFTLLLPLGSLFVLWPTVGLWLASEPVLWFPSGLYILTVIAPLILSGACTGLAMRLLLRNDVTGLIGALAVIVPLLAWRLLGAPPVELFSLSSRQLGLLIPTSTLVGEALVGLLPVPVTLAVGMLLIPARRVVPARSGFAGIVAMGSAASVHLARRHGALGLLVSATLLLGSALAAPRLLQFDSQAWRRLIPQFSPGYALPAGAIVTISHRSIHLTHEPEPRIQLRLTLESKAPETILLTFGDVMEVESLLGGDIVATNWALDPPVHAIRATGGELTVTLRPRSLRRRIWDACWHPALVRFTALGPWWGELVQIDQDGAPRLVPQRSSYELDLPLLEGVLWQSGAAAPSRAGDGGFRLEHRGLGVPNSLVAARFRRSCLQAGDLEFCLQTINPRGIFPTQLLRIHEEQIARLGRAFPGARLLPLFEVPESGGGNAFAITSGTLDRLQFLMPRLDEYGEETRPEFYRQFAGIHRGIVHELHLARFQSIDAPGLLAEPMADYLHEFAYNNGRHERLLQRTRRDLAFVPWQPRADAPRPFDVGPSQAAQWRGAIPVHQPASALTSVQRRRVLAFHHYLRSLLGDERWLLALRQLDTLSALDLEEFRRVMEAGWGASLETEFRQWLVEGVLPRLEVVEGDAVLVNDRTARSLTYRVAIRVRNAGEGRVLVPWRLQTEGEPLEDRLWLEPGEERSVDLSTIDRPLVFELDPDGWIAQSVDAGPRRVDNPRRLLFKAIREI